MKFYTTQAIAENMESNPLFKSFVLESVNRHLSGDCGETSAEDAALNNENPLDSLSSYIFEENIKIWIKQDGEILAVLFPEEY